MKCSNCGFETEQNSKYCINCGTQFSTTDTVVEGNNPAADKILPALKDGLFLAMCILMSLSCIFAIAADGLPVINILLTVFMWLAFADAQKGKVNAEHLRSISGTVYASYVVTNVASIMIIVGGALMGVALPFAVGEAGFVEQLTKELAENGIKMDELAEIFSSLNTNELETVGLILGIVIGVTLVVAGVVSLVVNILGIKKLHRLAQSVYQGVMYQNADFGNVKSARNWLVFFAVCNGLSTLTTFSSGDIFLILGTVCGTVTIIISIILIDNYLIQKPIYVE